MVSAEHGLPSSAQIAVAHRSPLSDLLSMHLDSLAQLHSKFGDLPKSISHVSKYDLRWHHQVLAAWWAQSSTESAALVMDRRRRSWPGWRSSGRCCCISNSGACRAAARWIWRELGWDGLRVPWWRSYQAILKCRSLATHACFHSLVRLWQLGISHSQHLEFLSVVGILLEVCDSVSSAEVFSKAPAVVFRHVSWCDVILK